MSKKLISLILAAVMMLTLAVPVFAGGDDYDGPYAGISDTENMEPYFKDPNLLAAVKAEFKGIEGEFTLTFQQCKSVSTINCENMNISDFSGIQYLVNLQWLNVNGNDLSNPENMAKIGELTELKEFKAEGCGITDASPLKNCTKLENLELRDNDIPNVEFASSLAVLKRLTIENNKISDLAPVAEVCKQYGVLEHLSVVFNNISNPAPFADMKSLKYLYASYNSLETAEEIGELTNLIGLELRNNKLTNLDFVKNLTNLERLIVDNNNLTDITALEGNQTIKQLYICENNPIPAEQYTILEDLISNGTEIMDMNTPPTHTCTTGKLAAGKPATCTEAGEKDYYYCETCGKNYEDAACTKLIANVDTWKVIPVKPHTPDGVWQATATHHWQNCKYCTDITIAKEVHDTNGKVVITKEPQVGVEGEQKIYCSVCDKVAKVEIIPALEAPNNTETKVEKDELTEVPEALKNNPSLDTVEEIKTAMETEITKVDKDVAEGNIENYDVKLLFTEDGGQTWIEATEENFPAKGLTITLPYPKGTSASTHDFVVVHMFTKGDKAGQIEMPKVTETKNGIQFTVTSLSPISLGWKEAKTTGGGNVTVGGGSSSSDNPAQDFWYGVRNEIDDADKGSTITINAEDYDSLPWYVMDAARANGVGLKIEWDGKTIKIPAGKALNEKYRTAYPFEYLAKYNFDKMMAEEIPAVPETGAPVNAVIVMAFVMAVAGTAIVLKRKIK